MALKGNLETVSLPDVFQILARQAQSGLLQIFASDGAHYVEIDRGKICAVSGVGGALLLGDLLIHHGFLSTEDLSVALNMQKTRTAKLGEILIENKFCTQAKIEEAIRFQITEEICDLFMIKSAEFEFFAGTVLDDKLALGGKFVKLQINPDSVLLEAARRMDEWSAIETKIPSGATLFTVTEAGREFFQTADRNTQIVLTLINDLRTFESIVAKSCLGRFRTGSIISEMLDAGAIQHLAFELYPQIAEKHLNEHRFKEARLIYRYSIDYIQDPVVRETMFKNLQLVEQRIQEQESGGQESQHSEIVRTPHLTGAKFSRRTWVLAAIFLAVAVGAGGITVGLILTRHRSDATLDDSAYEHQVQTFEQEFGNKDWTAAKKLLAAMVPKKEGNKEGYASLQDRFLQAASSDAAAQLAALEKHQPGADDSIAGVQQYIADGRTLVKRFPETLDLKTAVTKDLKSLDFSLDGLDRKLRARRADQALANILAEAATRPTDETLQAIDTTRQSKILTPAADAQLAAIVAEIAALRAAQARDLQTYRACLATHDNLAAAGLGESIKALQAASGFGPTPEFLDLTGGKLEQPQAAAADVETAHREYLTIVARAGKDPHQAAQDLKALLAKYPGCLERGRIAKIETAIEQFGP
ncbi:MAG: DUF4388 domain-containing protein [Planctomycetota bacterium]